MATKTIYVGISNNDCFNGSNLAMDSFSNSYKLADNKRKQKNIKYINMSRFIDDLSDSNIMYKLLLNDNLEVLRVISIKDDSEDEIKSELETISGIYPGKYLNRKNDILKLSEASVFLMVNNAINNIKQLSTDINNGYARISFKDIEELQKEKIEWEYAFDFCLAHLSRFGVEQKFNLETKRMEETSSFKAWFQWWCEYFQEIENNPPLYHRFIQCRRNCIDLDSFKPSGSFIDSKIKKI